MSVEDASRDAIRSKAEKLLARKKIQEAHLTSREKENAAFAEKTARLRQLRLAKEAAEPAKQARPGRGKRAS